MKYRPFGRGGWDVSEIGFGAWGLGGAWWGGRPDDAEALRALHRAADLGINFIDTALVYGEGHSERVIGRFLKERRAPLRVATKVPPKNHRWPADPRLPVRDAFPNEWIISCAENSLGNLGLERLDLLQLHVWSDHWMAQMDDWARAVETLKKSGKIRLWGVSVNNHAPDNALALVRSGLADSVQVIYNIFDQTPAERLFPLCREKNVAVIVRVPLDEGGLTGTLTPDTVFDDGDFRKNYFKGPRLLETVRRVENLRPLLRGKTETLPQAALKFCLSQPAVSTVIPGMRKASRVEENVCAVDGPLFSEDTLAALKAHAWPRNFYID